MLQVNSVAAQRNELFKILSYFAELHMRDCGAKLRLSNAPRSKTPLVGVLVFHCPQAL
jgi:hypothetical protein